MRPLVAFAAFSVAAGVGRFVIEADMVSSRRATNLYSHGLVSHRSCCGFGAARMHRHARGELYMGNTPQGRADRCRQEDLRY